MLTTPSLSRIRYNDNLGFKNVPFGYATEKYALDEAHFQLNLLSTVVGKLTTT